MSGELEKTTREERLSTGSETNNNQLSLQEVHCTEAINDTWRTEWGYKAPFSCLSSSSAGVCILFNNNFKFDILKTFFDHLDVTLYVILKLMKNFSPLQTLTLPTKTTQSFFFKQVFDRLHDFACEEIILGADFNLALDVKEDKKGGQNPPKCFENNQSKMRRTQLN